MKNTNKHLDDLFAAARHEEPIISEENAREILAKSEHMQTSPFIFSTKGIIMSTIGLSLAAFIGYLALSGSPQAPVTQTSTVTVPATNLFAHSTNSNTEDLKKSDAITTEVKDKTSPTPPTPPLPPIPPLPHLPAMISTPIKVTGIKPMVLALEKYAKMGVSKREDGTVTFSQKNENGKIFTMGFPKDSWGIIIGGKDLENVVSDAPRFAPLIVTDSKGNKRLIQFSSDKDGIKTSSMEINSHGTNEDIDDAVEIANMQIGGEDGDVDKLTVGNPNDTNISNGMQKQIHIKTNVQRQYDSSSSGDGIHSNSKRKFISITVNTDNHELDTVANGKQKKMAVMKMNKTINLDSIFNSPEETVAEAMKEAQMQIAGMGKELKNMNLDSIFRDANKTLKIAMKNSRKQIQEMDTKVKNYNMDSILQLANEKMKEAMKEMEDIDANLDRLIPILVRTATSEHYNKEEGITYDDGLIFWYDPGKDFLATMPEAQNSVGSSQTNSSEIISKAVLYPNPAKNKTTVHFDLSEPRTIAFSIHDLLGKRVLDGGSIRESSAGSYDHEFDLSELTPGVYLLVITTDKGEQSMQRLVIQK
jgi:hypothetical protein